jgi:AmmeMemoRadiSam system protein B/AmmeMemoRadiSam system protein A
MEIIHYVFPKFAIMMLKGDVMDYSYLIDIAKSAIFEDLLKMELIDKKSLLQKYPELSKQGATFVTLQKREQLRGCIGSLVAHRTLLEDIIHNAKSAAFFDTRFKPLTKEEFDDPNFSVEVSILTKPKLLEYDDIEDLREKIEIGLDGIILKLPPYQSTFLPQVWDQLPTFDTFFEHLCKKAGLDGRCLEKKPEIYRYRVQKVKDTSSTRVAGVMGQFYPSSCKEITNIIKNWNKILDDRLENKKLLSEVPKAIIVPHAGYIYSGFTANLAYRLLSNSSAKRVIVIGPSHHVYIEGLSVSYQDRYQTPCGDLDIDKDYIDQIQKDFSLIFNQKAHSVEHSTETQMPFIKHYFKDIKVIEFIYGKIDYKIIVQLISTLLQDSSNMIVISTDLSHFYNLKKAKELDNICLNAIKKKDSSLLDNGCEACGMIGIKAMLNVAKDKNLSVDLLDYRTSADASSDESRVVGYISAYFK